MVLIAEAQQLKAKLMLEGKFRPEKMVRKKMPDGSGMLSKVPERRRDDGGDDAPGRVAGVARLARRRAARAPERRRPEHVATAPAKHDRRAPRERRAGLAGGTKYTWAPDGTARAAGPRHAHPEAGTLAQAVVVR